MEHEMIQKKVKGAANVLRILAQIGFWVSIAFGALTAVAAILLLFPDTFAYKLLGSIGNGSIRFSLGMLSYDASSHLTGEQMVAINRTAFLVIAISCLIGALFLRQLIGILREVERGRPFSQANARRLGKMGIIAIVSSVAYRIGVAAVLHSVMDIAGLNNINVNYSPDANMIFVGILLFILAGIFKYGSYLQDEYDATV